MSCGRYAVADWEALLAHRFARGEDDPPELAEALGHLDDCAACRRTAVEIDPLLLFRGARELGEGPDVAQLTAAVRAGRRLRRLERRTGGRRRAGVAAALAAGALLLAPSALVRAPEAPPPAPEAGASLDVSASPVIENLDRPGARVYQWGSETVSVVMVVDESLDV